VATSTLPPAKLANSGGLGSRLRPRGDTLARAGCAGRGGRAAQVMATWTVDTVLPAGRHVAVNKAGDRGVSRRAPAAEPVRGKGWLHGVWARIPSARRDRRDLRVAGGTVRLHPAGLILARRGPDWALV